MKIPENRQFVLFGGAFVYANKLQAVADKRVEGLSTKQWFLLRNLQDLPSNPLPSITMLAKETDTSRQNVRKMLEVLERLGYVKLKENKEDRRSQLVEMTEQGCLVLKQVAAQAEPFFQEMFAGISREECAAAAEVIIKLINNLNKMQEEVEREEEKE